MQHLKLISLLQQLNRRELKQLDHYMQSPFFYKRRECVALYAYIKPFAPHFTHEKLDRKLAFAAIFEGQTYQAQRILRTVSELTRLVENCLAHLYMEEHEDARRAALAQHYQNTNQWDFLNTTLNEWEVQNKQKNLKSLDYYKQEVAILGFKTKSNDTNKSHFELLGNLDTALDTLFIVQKLRFYAQQISNAQIMQSIVDTTFLAPIMTYIAQSPELLDTPLVKLYYLPLQLLTQNEAFVFNDFLIFLSKNTDKFEIEDLRQAYLLAENICAINLRKGKADYWQYIFDLYAQEIKSGMLYNPDGSLRIAVFKNVITVGLRLGKYDWTMAFLNDNQARLPAAERDDVYQYNLANIHFTQKNYDATLDLLNKIHYTDVFYKLSARVLRLKAYYELQITQPFYADLLESELAAFKVFIYRLHEISKEHKENYRHFMLFLEKISKLNYKNDKKRLALREKVEKTANVAEKAWLLKIL
jgi:hypothetical protein